MAWLGFGEITSFGYYNALYLWQSDITLLLIFKNINYTFTNS